ncbi:alpha/beta fold hydrolase [Neiella marina]|uniref:Alpha/beta fold hydrolase n=1 Tax=Neiella holothuriorum TaxID=2870530 RepID=A0ABS7EIP1_9GAMM|nr:alpha/beta fold hydrolase [Neiella holothuriorum]MBW8192222.1 alpha/beta fold hydrolase [Neiella holothuriorum]
MPQQVLINAAGLDDQLHIGLHGLPVTPERPVIVMLHGFLGSCDDWLELIQPYLNHHSFALVDLPNHGRSSRMRAGQNSFHHWPQLLARGLQQLGIGKHALVGYSLGGRLALAYAARKPKGLCGLLLESCHPGLGSWQARLRRSQWQQRWQGEWLRQSARVALTRWYQLPVFTDLSSRQQVDQVNCRLRTLTPWRTAQAQAQFSLAKQPNYRRLFNAAEYPIHYLVGANDKKYAKLATTLKRQNPTLSTFLIQRAGHNVHAHQPEQWLHCFSLWLQTVSLQGSTHA